MKAHARLGALALAHLAACASTATPPPAEAAPYVPPRNSDGLVLYSGGVDAWFADPKDASLRAALALVDERVAELPAELGDSDAAVPTHAFALALDMLASPTSLRAGVAENPRPEAPPFYAQWTVETGDPARAAAVAARFAAVLADLGVPSLGRSEAQNGMQMLALGPLNGFHGVLGSVRPSTFAVAVGGVELQELELGSLDLPAGVRPFVAYKLDYGQYVQAMRTAVALAAGGPDGSGGPNPASAFAMFGAEDTVVLGGFGHGTDRMYGAMRQVNFVPASRASGLLASGPLGPNEIALVPSDATWAALTRTNPRGVLTYARKAFAAQAEANGMPPGTDPIALVTAFTGFDLEEQLFDHLGETWGAYMSDTTGGGGFFSMVAFMRVENGAGLVESLAWAESELNAAMETHAQGYVVLRRADLGPRTAASPGTPAWTLVFPGLPVPLEITLALDGGYLFAALTRQGAMAAIAQAASRKNGLAENERFRALAPGRLDDLYTLSFTDTPRLARDGYALVAGAGSALANATRSRSDRARDAGTLVPAYHDLLHDAKAMVGLGRLAGDDLVVTWQADRSLLVNACGTAGWFGGWPALAAVSALIGAAHEDDEPPPVFDVDVLEVPDAADTDDMDDLDMDPQDGETPPPEDETPWR